MPSLTRPFAIGACALSLLTAAPALAAPAASVAAQTHDDVVCLTVFAAAAGSAQNDDAKTMAGLGVLYFMGRIEGRDPTYDFRTRLAADIRALNPSDIENAETGCRAKLAARGQDLVALGNDLTGKNQ